MVDIASLGFNIDSSPVVRSHEALDMLAQRARAADQSVQGFGQQVSLANAGFVTFNTGLSGGTTHLTQMAASLQTVVGQLQFFRREIDLSATSFETFGRARDRVEALATSLGTGTVALERFARQASVVGMTSLETATGIQRVTAAIEGQTAAGRALREVMQDYGVVLNGMSASNADQVLSRFIDQARQFRATPGNTRIINDVLGPLSVEATTSILNPDYEPVERRRERLRVDAVSRGNAEMMDTAAQVIRDTRRSLTELDDLRRHYDVSRLSPGQLGTVFQGMETRPLSMRDPRNELEVLRYIDRFGDEGLRRGAGARSYNLEDPTLTAASTEEVQAKVANVMAQALQRRQSQGGWLGNGYLSGSGGASAFDIFRGSAAGMLLFGGTSAMFGGNPTAPLNSDSRAMSPVELARQRAAGAQRLSELGIGEPGRLETAEALLRALSRGEGKDRPSDALMALRDAYVVPTGVGGSVMQGDINAALLEANPRFENIYDLAQAGRDDAMQPGAGHLRQLDQEQWLLGVPPAQRGMARSLMSFAQSNNISTRQWSQRGLSPGALASGLVTGPGALSPRQADAFGRIRAGEDATYGMAVSEDTGQQVALQERIRATMDQGGAAVERVTAYWQAYNQALRAGRSEVQAMADATRALTLSMQRQETAAAQAAVTLRQQNDLDEESGLLVSGAGYDPVARRTAQLEGALRADFIRQERATGQLVRGTAVADEQRRGIGAQGVRGAEDIRAQTEAMVDQQRRVTAAAGARADVQARLASDMQVEAQFAQALAQARIDRDDAVVRKVQEHIEAVKQLRGEYDQLRTAAANAQYVADTQWQGGFSEALAGLPATDRRLARANAGQIRGGSPTAFLGAFGGATGSQWDGSFVGGSAASGGVFSPQMMAALARLESTMDPGARNGSVAGLMQFQPGTARDMGLTVSGDVDDRLDPDKSILAAGRYVQQLARQAGITGPVTSLDQVYRILERYGTVARGERLPAAREAIVTGALAAQTPGEQIGAWFGTPMGAAARDAQAGERTLLNTEANEEFAVQQARSRAILRLTMAGGGDFGRQLASAIVVDPRSLTGAEDATRRVRGVVSSRQEGIATQAAGLEETARGAADLAEAYRKSREEGEAFERHLGNNALVSALRNTAKEFPGVAKEVEALADRLERLNPLLDRAAANRATGQFWQGVRREELAGQYDQADIDGGWWASASARGDARARITAREVARTTANSDRPVSEDEAYSTLRPREQQRELAAETRNTRAEFDRLKISAMSAFENAILGGKGFSGVLQALGQDLARFGLRMGPERLLMKGMEAGTDWIGKQVSEAGVGGLMSALNPFSWFSADGLIISNGVPHRNAASGMLLNRPTTFMAQGGTVTAGEIAEEAIFPLKRDASGNLGIRAAGGGPSVVINAPITVEGGATKGGSGGGMEPAAMAQLQRDFERTLNQAIRNTITNERRDGGDLSI